MFSLIFDLLCLLPSYRLWLKQPSNSNKLLFLLVKVQLFYSAVNSLRNNNILDWSKFKAFADNKINVTYKLKFVSERIENILGKGENVGNQHFTDYQHFLLFPKCFQKPPSLGL